MDTILSNSETIYMTQSDELDFFNSLILRHQDFLFRLAQRIMRDESLAADSVQDACLLAFRKFSSFRGGSFRNWLARIVVNVCYDELRRQRRHPVQSLEPLTPNEDNPSPYWLADTSASPEAQLERKEWEATLQACIERLPSKHQAILILIDMEELSYEEAAEILEIPIGTVKSRLARARIQLKNVLQVAGELLPVRYRLDGLSPAVGK